MTWRDIAGLDEVINELQDTVILPFQKRHLLSGSKLFQPPKGTPLQSIFKPTIQICWIRVNGVVWLPTTSKPQDECQNSEDIWGNVGTVWHILWCLQAFCCSVHLAVGRLWSPRQQLKPQAASLSTFRLRRWQTCGTGSHRSWPLLSSR